MIVAHLDLDAFFAAVEELEDPNLRTKPLVVGGDPHGRGVVATANYVARKFGIHSAMSCAEALRRCPQTVFVRPRHSLYREYSQHVWETVRGVVPDRGENRARRGLPRHRRGRTDVPGSAQARRSGSDVCSRGDEPHVRPRRLDVEGGRQGRERPSQAGWTDRGLRRPGGELPGAVRRAPAPGVGPEAEERLLAAGVATIGSLAALGDLELRSVLPGSVGRVLHDRARGIDPRGLEQQTQRISISVENTFEQDLTDRAQLHAELRRMADRLAEMLRGSGRTARTVSTKLRYTDFSIRTRSTSLRVGIDEPAKIGELACALLDRALADRPGALRLVGVGLSGLASHQQLALV